MSHAPVVILHTDAHRAARKVVERRHPDLTVHHCPDYDGLAVLVRRTGAEVVYSVRFAGTPNFPRAALVDSATVGWVSVGGSGTDHLGRWDPSRLTVTNAAGVAAGMMAEYALGMMLCFSLGLPRFARAQAARDWTPGRVEPVAGKSVLILGLGNTGRAVARRARAMGMTTLGVRANPQATEHVDEVHGIDGLPGLWARAAYIVCCVPLLEDTKALVNAAAFAAMAPGTVLIDVSRGGVVEEIALVAALRSGKLRGAALDVFANEPLPPEHAFWGMENVIVTPHCSSVYDGWDLQAVGMFCDNLDRYRQGLPLLNVVDPIRGY